MLRPAFASYDFGFCSILIAYKTITFGKMIMQ